MKINQTDSFTIEITEIRKGQYALVREAARNAARHLQDRIADEFESEKYAAGELGQNSPAYDAWKKKAGYDTRRGHLTGRLQNALWNQRLYDFNAVGDAITISFNNARMRGRASQYVQYYEEAKASAGLLSISEYMLDQFRREIMQVVPGQAVESEGRILAFLPEEIEGLLFRVLLF